MPRMFDILRGKGGDNSPEKKKEEPSYDEFPQIKKKDEIQGPKSYPLSFPKNILAMEVKKEAAPEDHSIVSKKLICAVKQRGVDNQERARQIYENAVETIKTLLGKARAGEDLYEYMDKLHELLDDVFNQLMMGDNLLNEIYEEAKEEYYLPYHIVNVLVLSSVLGLSMGFNKSRLSHLGLACIFHDLGMDLMKDFVNQPKTLTKENYEVVKTHISRSLEIAGSISILSGVVKETIATHHERASGKGYPRGIRSDDINPYAKILGLVDTYEAMTHTRPYRERINTRKAVRSLIGPLKNDFDTDVMKFFINKMSVYPIGSIVKLDTGDMARVISVQPGSPLRPVVMVFRDSRGENITDMTIIDLFKQDFPSIKDSV